MSKPIVSVYCLAYNHEKYIRNALNGFVSQKTDFEYEVFVHDDASTDNTADIIREYEAKYPNIIKGIYQTENQYSKGIQITNKFIFPKMTGKYIAICEGDDYWCDSNKLQIQVDFLESHPKYVACAHNTFSLNSRTGEKKLLYNVKEDYDILFKDIITDGGKAYHTSSIMYKIDYALTRPQFFEIANKINIGDYPLSIYLTLSGKVRFINKPMSVYRYMAAGSWSQANTSNERNVVIKETKNEMLRSVNEYSCGKYDKEINLVILQNEFQKYEITKNFDELKDKRFNGIWRGYPLIFQLKRFLKRYFGNYL